MFYKFFGGTFGLAPVGEAQGEGFVEQGIVGQKS
jgi:hypothetical protein